MTPLLISLAFGFLTAFSVWTICVLLSRVPREDRHFLDRPALGFRVAWPLIQTLVYYAGHFLSETQRHLIHARLTKAGVEYSLTPQQFVAAKVISAITACVAMWLVGKLLPGSFSIVALLALFGGFYYPELWLRETIKQREVSILRTLPFYLDVITLAVEAGSNLTGGLTQAVQKTADTPLRREFSRVLRDIRSGKSRADALRDMADRTGNTHVANVVRGLIQAEKTGASFGPMLRAQAEQLRSDRFLYAEKKAMEAPVKMLAPLMMFFFPTTVLVIVYILISKAIIEGLLTWQPIVWAYYWPG